MEILIIKGCVDAGADSECSIITEQMKLYGAQPDVMAPQNTEEVFSGLAKRAGKHYDYIYLISHGNEQSFGTNDDSISITWDNFAQALCEFDIMNEECTLMLSCCRGGLNQVAHSLFYACPKIDYVIGPRQSLVANDLLVAFNIIFYNLMFRAVDAVIACKKVELGTDLRFVCFDRLEVATDPSFYHYKLEMESKMKRQVAASLDRLEEQWIPPEVLKLRKDNAAGNPEAAN